MAEAEPHGPDMYASLNNLGLGPFASQVTATAAPLVTQLLEMLAQVRYSAVTLPSKCWLRHSSAIRVGAEIGFEF